MKEENVFVLTTKLGHFLVEAFEGVGAILSRVEIMLIEPCHQDEIKWMSNYPTCGDCGLGMAVRPEAVFVAGRKFMPAEDFINIFVPAMAEQNTLELIIELQDIYLFLQKRFPYASEENVYGG